MRKTRRIQPTLMEPWLDMPHAKELQTISRLLDDHPRSSQMVAQDLASPAATSATNGLTGEQVLRALIVKQMNGFSYRELAFHLADSSSYRRFCHIGFTDRLPSKSALATNIKRVKAATLEVINRELVVLAEALGVERGRKVRVDSTAVPAMIHEPSDSYLLWDCVRVVTRLCEQARELEVGEIVCPNRTRRAKRRARAIHTARTRSQRARLYRDLLRVCEEVCRAAARVSEQLWAYQSGDVMVAARAAGLAAELDRVLALAVRVIEQTRRRVLQGEQVSAADKVVSIFEDHADVIVKAPRETVYGHKVFLTCGASSMVMDCVVTSGNPADSSMAVTMVDRQRGLYGRPPRQAAFDGGFASRANLTALKREGVRDVMFCKRRGLEISEMARSVWVYQRLRDFRAGVEGCISFLKRVFGLARCS
jgi:IS5 family transposase